MRVHQRRCHSVEISANLRDDNIAAAGVAGDVILWHGTPYWPEIRDSGWLRRSPSDSKSGVSLWATPARDEAVRHALARRHALCPDQKCVAVLKIPKALVESECKARFARRANGGCRGSYVNVAANIPVGLLECQLVTLDPGVRYDFVARARSA